MNNKIRKNEQSSEEAIEVLLGAMAFNSNMPIVYVEDKRSLEPKMIGTRTTLLPVGKVDYITTMNYMVDICPQCKDLLSKIGIDLKSEKYEKMLLHSELVKYLAVNDIPFHMDSDKGIWEIEFPEQIVKKLLNSKYKYFLENSRDFYNRFYCENLILRLRKSGLIKSRQFIKS